MRWVHGLLAMVCAAAIVFSSGGAAMSASAGTADGFSASAGEWYWPIAPPLSVLGPFEAPATPYAAGHRGIDLAAAEGTPVLAVADGRVSFAGSVVDRPIVSVAHGDGVVSSIEPVTPSVAEGDRVRRGDPIGVVAAGGHCSGRCIHLGARVHGQYVSPLAFIGGIPRAILLPLG